MDKSGTLDLVGANFVSGVVHSACTIVDTFYLMAEPAAYASISTAIIIADPSWKLKAKLRAFVSSQFQGSVAFSLTCLPLLAVIARYLVPHTLSVICTDAFCDLHRIIFLALSYQLNQVLVRLWDDGVCHCSFTFPVRLPLPFPSSLPPCRMSRHLGSEPA